MYDYLRTISEVVVNERAQKYRARKPLGAIRILATIGGCALLGLSIPMYVNWSRRRKEKAEESSAEVGDATEAPAT